MVSSVLWEPGERAGLKQSTECEHRLIPAPLNPNKESDGYFDLYYFVPKTGDHRPGGKNILFCAGGPGEMVIPGDDELWLSDLIGQGYNVVFFHLRGSGFSQIPASNEYDRFLRTKYAVNDLEAIRANFLNTEPWDAVVGYSYGTVLAQQRPKKRGDKLKRLGAHWPALHAPILTASDPRQAFEKYTHEVEQIRREILERIQALGRSQRRENGRGSTNRYEWIIWSIRQNSESNRSDREKTFGIFRTIETQFTGEWFVIEKYNDLKEKGILANCGLDYSLDFENLRSLRFFGWNPLEQPIRVVDKLKEIGNVLTQEILARRSNVNRRKVSDQHFSGNLYYGNLYVERSQRDYDVMGVYDGISRAFLREWLGEGRKDFAGAITRSAGKSQKEFRLNRHIEKIGVFDSDIESIEPWDPAKYCHDVPTVILRGTADPVTAGGQAERYREFGLNGWKYFLEFDGVGHQYVLPEIKVRSRVFKTAFRADYFDPIDLIVSAAVEMKIDDFSSRRAG